MMDIYTEAARENGYEPGPENFGYLCRIHVQDTDEKAYESAKGFLTGNVGVGRVPMPKDYMLPVGYSGNRDDPARARYQGRIRKDPFLGLGLETASYDEILASNRWIVGSPETVVRKLRETLSVIRPGILGVWTNDGDTTHADTMRCLELMGQEVLPALREIGEDLELTDPFQKAAAATA
jgi:alkanesulfonate monooxygenase SsuD/methylene tetrahydromethanopterin reductase-like flavin-dependent oxidoreductase (luciferase family)